MVDENFSKYMEWDRKLEMKQIVMFQYKSSSGQKILNRYIEWQWPKYRISHICVLVSSIWPIRMKEMIIVSAFITNTHIHTHKHRFYFALHVDSICEE